MGVVGRLSERAPGASFRVELPHGVLGSCARCQAIVNKEVFKSWLVEGFLHVPEYIELRPVGTS